MIYHHQQQIPGWVYFAGVAGLLPFFALAIAGMEQLWLVSIPVAAIVLAVLNVFGRLTVEVEHSHLRASFGWGWPSKRLDFSTASAARIVRNRWWYGFGIRLIPHGWMWNVWGLDAVEFDLDTGKVLRIGTDQPHELLAAVTRTVPAG